MVAFFALPTIASIGLAAAITPRWPAVGLLLIQASRESLGASDLTGTGPTVVSVDVPKVVQSEYELMVSDAVLRQALLDVGPTKLFPNLSDRRYLGLLPPLPEQEVLPRAADRLRQALTIGISATSNIVRVTAAFPDKDRSVLALSAVLRSYFTHRNAVFAQGNAEALSAGTDRMMVDLRNLDEKIAAVRSKAQILDPEQDIHIANTRIENIVNRIDRLRESRAATNAQLQAAQAALALYPQQVQAAEETTNLSPNDNSRNDMSRMMLERTHMAAEFQSDYPPLRDLDRRIATLRQSMAANERRRSNSVRDVRNPAVEQLSLRIATLTVDANAMGQQMDELERQRAEAETRAAAVLRAETTLRDLGRQRDALEASFHQIANRETAAQISEDAGRSRSPTVTIAQAPMAEAEPRDLRPSFLVAGLFAGILGAGGAAVLLTLLRRSYATTEEATRGLALPGLASIPPHADLQSGRAIAPITDLAALLLDVRASGDPLCLVQFVGTGPNDGRDRIALSVAVEIARSRAARTLLVDLDTDGRALLGAMGIEPGHGRPDPESILAIQTPVANLRIAYQARTTALGDPRVSVERTVALLERLRQDFDVVVLVALTDGGRDYAMRRLTALVDVNVLVLRAEHIDGDVAQRARDMVLTAGGRLLGFVMNAERQIVPQFLARLVA